MDKQKLYQQIQRFNNKLTNPSDRGSKSYEKAYLYVDDKNAIDKAEFVKFLIDKGYMTNNYQTILDLTFGSGNLTSHIVFDNDIKYENIIFNDRNVNHTNQDIIDYIDNAEILDNDILDTEIFKDQKADLVIVNPQIGGNYIDGNILEQKEDKESQQEILDKLGETLKSFLDDNATVLFYGKEKDLKSILSNDIYIRYKSTLIDMFVVSKDFDKSLCFEKKEKDFIECLNSLEDDEEINSFDDIELVVDTYDSYDLSEAKEDKKTMKTEETKEKFIKNEIEYNFPHKNLLLKGVPGTGKSQTIENIIENQLNLKDKPTNICRINIHSASSNADLMQGIGINSNNGDIEYKEKQGLIYNHIKKALFAPNQPFVLVLEEIQENSLNELIGDLIYLIEDKKRVVVDDSKFEDGKEYEYQKFITEVLKDKNNKHYIEIPYLVDTSTSYRKMVLPSNLYIFCTSNYRDDKKVIEDNLLRRFDVIEIYPQTHEALGEDIFKSKDVSDFLEKLNDTILKKFEDEIHPDRYLIGHANWLDITDEDTKENKKLFYTALLKVIIEFKEIREVDFDSYAKDILESALKGENLSERIEEYIKKCAFEYSSYKEMVEKLQKKIYSSFLK
jgi:hypothetical protein